MENEKKFHEKTWFMWVMMFLITPVGIVLMWKNNKYKPVVRVLISVIFGFMFISVIVGGGTSNSTNSNEVVQAVEEVPELTPEEQAKVDFDLWVKTQFSSWDGSNTPLVELVKKNMNDPKSFEHVETVYKAGEVGTGIAIEMTYRGKNGFGGLVKGKVTAYADYESDTITIMSAE